MHRDGRHACFLKTIVNLNCILLLALFLTPCSASSIQTQAFTHINKNEGLPDNTIITLMQDRASYMWIGTSIGLARFNGQRMRVWQPELNNQKSLSNGFICALLEGEDGTMWVGSLGGLDRIDRKTEQVERIMLPDATTPIQKRVWALAPNRNGKLWIANNSRLLVFDPQAKQFTNITIGSNQNATARAMISDGYGGVWVASAGNAYHFNADAKIIATYEASLDANNKIDVGASIRSLLLDKKNRLWLGTHAGLKLVEPQNDRLVAQDMSGKLGIMKERVFTLLEDEESNIWVGQSHALIRISPEQNWKLEYFKHDPSIASSVVSESPSFLYQDNKGSLWVGTWGLGLSLSDLRQKGFSRYRHSADDPNSLNGDNVLAIAQEKDQYVWIGMYGTGLNKLNLQSGKAEHFSQEETGAVNIKTMYRESPSRLWIGGDDGLHIYNPEKRNNQLVPLKIDVPGSGSISSLVIDKTGYMWAGSAAGLHRITPDLKTEIFRTNDSEGSLKHDVVDTLMIDKDDNLWIGTKGGLQLWTDKDHRFSQPILPNEEVQNPASLPINGLFQDHRGRIWVTTNFGLYELQRRQNGWQLFSRQHIKGMPHDSYLQVLEDEKGFLWISGEDHLVQLHPDRNQVVVFSRAEGQLDANFNLGAALKKTDGTLLFGTRGLLSFHPKDLTKNDSKVNVVLSDILELNHSLSDPSAVDGNRERLGINRQTSAQSTLRDIGIAGLVRDAKEITLSPKQSVISFEFAALQFYNLKQNRLAWKLEGFDRDWTYGKPGEAIATYTNLDQGNYTLLVKARRPSGVWDEPTLELPITVTPPIWKDLRYRGAFLAFTIFLLFILYKRRVDTLNNTRKQLEQEVAKRTSEIIEQKEQLRAEKDSADHQRELAEQARRDILLLSEIGRDIGNSLDIDAIQNVFYTHVCQLMTADIYGMGLVDREARIIRFDRAMCGNVPYAPYYRSLDDLEQASVQCVVERKDILLNEMDVDQRIVRTDDQSQSQAKLVDGSTPIKPNSCIYIPMIVKDQVIGVVTVLSEKPHVYHESHLDILRTLGAYAAVAVDKANAYKHLKSTQSKLVEQEKLAALGSIVAAVAHELNTPIGNSLLVASSLKERYEEFIKSIQTGSLKRSEIDRYCKASNDAIEIILRNLETSAQLVSSFKQVSADQTSNQRRQFELGHHCTELARTLAVRLRKDGHELEVVCTTPIQMDTYPGPLGQVISNLILNSLLHAFDERMHGKITVSIQKTRSNFARIICHDNGKGIPEKHIGRIFEPFFTTRLGQGGSGLGLHICYNIITSLLGGTIQVESKEGEGASFIIEIPMILPENTTTDGEPASDLR